MRSNRWPWPLSEFERRRRVARLGRLKALARATCALYASNEPFTPYRTVNRVQRAMSLQFPWVLRPFVPRNLRVAAGRRAAQAVLASAQAQLVREAIVTWHRPCHRAVLPLPVAAWKAWSSGGAAVDWRRSGFVFAFHLAERWLSGLRRLLQLARHMRAASTMPSKPYIVAVNVTADIVNCAEKGGFLNWLKNGPALSSGHSDIVAVARKATANDTQPAWLHLSQEALPPLERISIGFLIYGCLLLVLTPILALMGVWQGLALLPDLIELGYLRRVQSEKLARAYLFLLGDQTRRPLWTFYVASRDVCVALVFYASSYQLFSYGSKIPEDIRNPSLLLNTWDECWFQTDKARDDVVALLPHKPVCRVLGAFDMVDSGEPLPQFSARAVAVFDVEPGARPLRLSNAGYILPTVTEFEVLYFWQKLADIARDLNFVLVHKPKRYGLLRQEWRYRRLLQTLKSEGRYLSLSPEIGPMRLMRQLNASVILPFTSVGDLAVATGATAFYFDARLTIPDPEKHSGGLPVAAGVDTMSARLKECLSKKDQPLKASIR